MTPIIVDLACDSPTQDFRMAAAPPLRPGRYKATPVDGGRFQAWTAWKPSHNKGWMTKFTLVHVGLNTRSQEAGNPKIYKTPQDALAQATPHVFEVKGEEVVIFLIADSGQDNGGGLRLEITAGA